MAKNDFVSFSYVNSEGEDSKLGSGVIVAIKATFKEFDDELFPLTDLNDALKNASLAYGMQVKLQRGTAGKAQDKPDEAYDAILAIWERATGGDWLKERESAGPRTSLVFEAIVRVLTAAGRAPDEAKETMLRESLKDADARTAALANARVAAAFEAIKAERAMERAAKAQAKAEAEGDTELPF